MKFVKVAIARPLRKTFTYKNLLPNENIIGKRVFIEFHRKKIIGVVVQMCSNVDEEFEIKQIISVLDETPLFESNFLKKIKDISQKFFFPIGELLSLFTPNLMRKPKHSDELQKYKIDDTKFEITNNFFKKLTDEQKLAVKNIQNSKKQEHLIFGVTSSGKTEVYKHLIYDEFKKNNSAIVLVPEILGEVLEIQEKIEIINEEERIIFAREIDDKLNTYVEELDLAFRDNDFQKAKNIKTRISYLQKVFKDLRNR